MKRMMLAVGLMLCGTAGLAAAQTAAPPQAVGYITAEKMPVYDESSYVGRIAAPQIVQLQARVTGFLEQQNFTDGDYVKKGQLLYVIEQPPYQAAVAEAQAAVESAQAKARNSALAFGRAQALLRSPAGQQSVVDAAAASAASDAAAIASAQAQLQTAQIDLGYTEIRAPIDGQIGATAVTTGNVVGPTSGTLATIVSQDPMYVSFALPVVDALKFRNAAGTSGGLNNLDLLVQLPDGSKYGQVGQINFINNQVTADTDTLTWRGTIANPKLPAAGSLPGSSRALTDGEFITVILRARTPRQQIVIPRDAVITDQLGDYVLEVDKTNKVVRVSVTMGDETNDSVQILAGVNAGDRIITQGIQRIHPGVTVAPQPAQNS
jgi:membrane fusion protein (multidrug efflux system)